MRSEQEDDPTLIQLLRAEALGSRPSFDAAAAAAVIATIRGRATPLGRARRMRSLVATACLGLACGAAAWLGDRTLRREGFVGSQAESVTAAAAVPDFDALPTFDELRADVADGLGAVAATVVGVPDWRDLAVAELLVVDVARFGGEPGMVSGPEAAGDLGTALRALLLPE